MVADDAVSTVLSLNSGSSSLKLGLYSFHNGKDERLVWGEAEELGSRNGRLWLHGAVELHSNEPSAVASAGAAAQYSIQKLLDRSAPRPDAVGHRIVHGGPKLRTHQRITSEVITQLNEAIPFAPLHLPPALDVLKRAMEVFPNVSHIACFDTAFHRTMPDVAARLPFGREFFENGIQRYGFHGLSCESIVRALGSELAPRTVIAHLGNGCSITAVKNGSSLDTTMGLTPTGGVVMGTRPGDLDPGVLLNLLRSGYDEQKLDSLLNHYSGLLGVSGISSDMRQLLSEQDKNADARLAIEMFCYSVRRSIAAMAAVLGGIDMLVFTGGIGEHSAMVRREICSNLQHLGVALDETANQNNAIRIGSGNCKVRVIATDEDLEIALHARTLSRSREKRR
ncbi:MAG TPA: acetate/propionate family kinase [Terriglobales bacterium]|nr:acetate/propionate family kinase [Terriglobales bacterium]